MKPKTSKPKPTRAQQIAAIRALRGLLRPKPGEPPFAGWWARHKAEERALEERRESFPATMIKKTPRAGATIRSRPV
jgi:hypothetical protein